MIGFLQRYPWFVIVSLRKFLHHSMSHVNTIDGGAGTTAIGIYLGKPTIVVPFFGDQPFWGAMIHHAGAGPSPIPHKKLTALKLAAGIEFCMTTSAQEAAQQMGAKIRAEVSYSTSKSMGFTNICSQSGVQAGVDSFHAHLPLLNMR